MQEVRGGYLLTSLAAKGAGARSPEERASVSTSGEGANARSAAAVGTCRGIVGLGGILSAFIGGWISTKMSDTVSNLLFATLLAVVAIRLILQVRKEDKAGVVQH
jgi:hypothetical protein